MAGDDSEGSSEGVSAWSETHAEPAASRAASRPPPEPVGDPPVRVKPLELDQKLETVSELGGGGMGSIRLSLDPHLGRHVAVKALRAELEMDEEEVNRFIAEAQVTGQLEHPNVVPVYALARDEEEQLFFTMKLVRGQTLGQLLDEMGEARLEVHNLERLIEIVIKVCDAVAFAHCRGVIHRDIKPENLMIGSFGQVYVMDWGIAALSRSEHLASDDNKLLGTPGYMAPEQMTGEGVCERADVFAIGGLLYVILTAGAPHRGNNLSHLLVTATTEGVQPPEERVPELTLPPELCRIARKALSLDKWKRYGSVLELREELVAFQHGGGWLATRTFAPGDAVYREGDAAEEAFVITEGECEAFRDVDGKREVLRHLVAGEIFGEAALLSGGKRSATVVATSDMTVKVLTRASLARELERNQWMKALFDGVAERFRLLEGLLRSVVGED